MNIIDIISYSKSNTSPIVEGLFPVKVYTCSYNKIDINKKKSYVFVYNNPKHAVLSKVGSKYDGPNGKAERMGKYQTNIIDGQGSILVNSKNKDKLNKEVYLYELTCMKISKPGKYGDSVNISNIVKTRLISNKSLLDMAKSYGINIVINDNTTDTNSRKKLYTQVLNISKEELKKINSKYKLNGAIHNIDKSDYEDLLNDFYNGEENEAPIFDWDLYKYSTHPRTDSTVDTYFWKAAMELESNINKRISSLDCKVSIEGDWDDGVIELQCKKQRGVMF